MTSKKNVSGDTWHVLFKLQGAGGGEGGGGGGGGGVGAGGGGGGLILVAMIIMPDFTLYNTVCRIKTETCNV